MTMATPMRRSLPGFTLQAAALVTALLFLAPIAWTVLASLKPAANWRRRASKSNSERISST